jgi:hypothetical protein
LFNHTGEGDVSFPYPVMAIAHVMIEEHKRFAKVDA